MVEQLFNRFEMRAEIGYGGMARVYQAYDPQTDRLVAIKVLPPEYLNDLGFRARFEREAELIAALEHEAIVPVYEFGTHEGQPYIVMQYMPKGSLAERLLQGPLSPEESLRVLKRVAAALDYAHPHGIIHRDLKTSNILFDREFNAYLADFGIALRSESTWQRNLAISGTPAYMSPEQGLREEKIDGRSDIYSLGVIVFEMLTGQLPFAGEIALSIVLKHIHDPCPSIGSINPDLPAGLDPVLQRAMAKMPEERYPSAQAFVDDYRRALQRGEDGRHEDGTEDEPVSISEPTRDLEVVGKEAQLETGIEAQPSYKPEFPELTLQKAGEPDGAPLLSWEGRYSFALALVTWLGVFLAAVTVAFTRGPDLMPAANIRVVYTESAVAVINISDEPIRFADLVFERLSEQGEVTAAFEAAQWSRLSSSGAGLGQGNCLQLLREEATELELTPGNAPAKPEDCDVSQAWLMAQNQAWNFWLPGANNFGFRIVLDETVVHICNFEQSSCEFHLPAD
ncbi:MAG TPA: serine/threonine-protein kinase [Anaerolineales bacterium]